MEVFTWDGRGLFVVEGRGFGSGRWPEGDSAIDFRIGDWPDLYS